MTNEVLALIADALSASSLPIYPNKLRASASRVLTYYQNASSSVMIPIEEIPERFSELWHLWFTTETAPPKELKSIVQEAIASDPSMEQLAQTYFSLIEKFEKKWFMERSHAVALAGSAPLVRTLVHEQHLGLERINSILNVPGATYEAVKQLVATLNIPSTLSAAQIAAIHHSDTEDISKLFGDLTVSEAAPTLKELLGDFSRSNELWEEVLELLEIDFAPYLFLLYYELLTLDTTDRFPGEAIYECQPRAEAVKSLWNSMYHPTQENPYLNNAKSAKSLDIGWAQTKISPTTRNGSLLLVDIFAIIGKLPYSSRRQIARIIRCYLAHAASKTQISTPLPEATPAIVQSFVERVASSNSQSKGVLDQRFVDFLTRCTHDASWLARGLGSSVNETNAASKKFGDVEYTRLDGRFTQAFEAHGGTLRDEYVQAHINSLHDTVAYFKSSMFDDGVEFNREIEIVYVAHNISRLKNFASGHSETIDGVHISFTFITFEDLLDQCGGASSVSKKIDVFTELVHERISRLPDTYSLKQRYIDITTANQ